jgi:glycosyltransferase involved in cell wall biosynthesis
MCAYNGMPFIKEAIQSVIEQSYKNWELIISDDGSTDGTREYLSTLSDLRIRVIFQSKNLGYVKNKNTLHFHANGEYITQLDNDDIYDPYKIEKQVEYVLNYPEAKLIGTGFRNVDENGATIKNTSVNAISIISTPVFCYPFWYPSLLVHTSVFESVGYYDEYFTGMYGDDIYWTVRANEQFEIHVIPDILYSYRYHTSSITNTFVNERKLLFRHVLMNLIKQRLETGSDWLEMKNYEAMRNYETEIQANKHIRSTEYQILAAKAVDHCKNHYAIKYITKSLLIYPFNIDSYKTIIYLLKNSIKSWF